MSINYQNIFCEMTVCCDNCHEEEEVVGEWQECIDILKRKGWKIFKDRYGEWTQDCPDCVKGSTAEEDFK